MIEIDEDIVNAEDGNFETHPESYSPRIFIGLMPPVDEAKVYEILANGQAIPWPCLPVKSLVDFDFWVIYTDSLSDVTMMRHNIPYSRFVTIQADRDSGTSHPFDHLPEGSH